MLQLLKQEMVARLTEAAMPVDGQLLLDLTLKYKGRYFYDYERDKATYRVDDILYVDNKKNSNPPCWEAICIRVELRDSVGWCVSAEHLVEGTLVVKNKSHVGFGLVELVGPSETPSPMPWVDLYITRHEENATRGLYIAKT